MKKEELKGMWILEAREDNEDNYGNTISFSFMDAKGRTILKSYEIVESDQEVLYFDDGGGKCLQIGIRIRTEEERLEFDHDTIFEQTSHFPGSYDLGNKTIDLTDPGKFDILKDGRLHIVQNNIGGYHCEEYWVRIPPEHIDLALFVQTITKKFN